MQRGPWSDKRRAASDRSKPVPRPCSVESCEATATTRGFCRKHYRRWKEHGDPLATVRVRTSNGAPRAFLDALPSSGEGCVAWPFVRVKGYGQITIDGQRQMASRVVCERVHGPAPSPQHVAAHSCGKGHEGCVAPWHLSWKTYLENSADAREHGTVIYGEKNHLAKLTEDQVRAIRALKGKLRQVDIARRFGVNQTAVSLILRGKTWAWLK